MPIVAAYIVPHPPIAVPAVGRGKEGKIGFTLDALHRAAEEIRTLKPDTVVITSPHSTVYLDYIHISPGESASGGFSRFGVSDVAIRVNYDTAFVAELEKAASDSGIAAGTLGEQEKDLDHGVLVPLWYINQKYTDYKLVRIGISGMNALEHYRFGKLIAQTAEALGRRIVFVASGDLSHKLKSDGPYGFAPEGPEFDRQLMDAASKADFLAFMNMAPAFCNAAAECGLRSFIIMAGALDGKAVEAEPFSYEGPFGVGYGICAYKVTGDDLSRCFDALYEAEENKKIAGMREQEDAFVHLARAAAEHFVKTGKDLPLPADLPPELTENKAGVFVSCKKRGELRGCIGTIYPVTSTIAKEIIRNARSAVAEDPRFSPVQAEELPFLSYSVDVMGSPEPTDLSGLDPSKYGVIVTGGGKRGLLLPNLEGVVTAEQQVATAVQKAGITPGESCAYERFEVVRHT